MNLETLLAALRLTAIGMGVVFSALVALSLLMRVLPFLAGERGKKGGAQTVVQPLAEAVPESVEQAGAPAVVCSGGGISPEIIVVLATAVAAYLGQTPENLNIVSIRRAPTAMGPWSMAARRESIQN